LVLGTTTALQRWRDGKPENITAHPLPNVDDLNTAIPESEWPAGFNDKPEPPWKLMYVVYLIDPRDGSTFTYLNSTQGCEIAVGRLSQRIRSTRLLRGKSACPLIELRDATFPTKAGPKRRPDFKVLTWHALGDDGAISAPLPNPLPTAPAAIGKPVKPVSTAEELNDENPF
jgi:hypothetical protein